MRSRSTIVARSTLLMRHGATAVGALRLKPLIDHDQALHGDRSPGVSFACERSTDMFRSRLSRCTRAWSTMLRRSASAVHSAGDHDAVPRERPTRSSRVVWKEAITPNRHFAIVAFPTHDPTLWTPLLSHSTKCAEKRVWWRNGCGGWQKLLH